MTENSVAPDDAAAPEWNPLATLTTTRHPLKVSGGKAAILCRRWDGATRLAYEDAITERMLTEDGRGEETVKIGTLRLFAVSLTVRGSEGFPEREPGRAMFAGTREQVEADLLALDPDTFDEIRKIALDVQPLPSAKGDDAKDDEDSADGDDPFLTPSTPAGDPVDA